MVEEIVRALEWHIWLRPEPMPAIGSRHEPRQRVWRTHSAHQNQPLALPSNALLSRGRKSAVFSGLQCENRARWQSVRGDSLMRTRMPVLAMIVLAGFCSQASAQARCPELSRLRSEAAGVLKPTRGLVPTLNRCEAYNRFSMAWATIVQYANDNREACDISTPSLDEFEKYHREAVQARDNVCAGRPLRPFPPDIIRR
jgi:hypothetical protein